MSAYGPLPHDNAHRERQHRELVEQIAALEAAEAAKQQRLKDKKRKEDLELLLQEACEDIPTSAPNHQPSNPSLYLSRSRTKGVFATMNG